MKLSFILWLLAIFLFPFVFIFENDLSLFVFFLMLDTWVLAHIINVLEINNLNNLNNLWIEHNKMMKERKAIMNLIK